MSRRPCVVITYPHSLGAGGGGTVGCIEIARHLRRRGADVVVATVTTMSKDRRLFRNPPLPEQFRGRAEEAALIAEGVEIVNVPPSPVHWYVDAVPVRRAVKRILAQRRVDAVIGWHHEFALLPRLLRRHGVVAGLFTAGWYRDYGRSRAMVPGWRLKLHIWIQRVLLLAALRRISVVFAISEFTRGEVMQSLDVPSELIQVAPWGVDPVFGHSERREEPAITRFLFFGSPAYRKGGFETLEAFGKVAAQGHRDWSLKMVWTRRPELEQRARDLGIADCVTVLDPMGHAGLARELAWAQVAVLPSTFESFGLACAEAHVSGVPVIAYRVGGVHEVVEHGITGWLLENERPELIPGAIIDAMADPSRTFAMGLRGRERVANLYAWERTAATILARIEAVQNGRA